MTFIVILLYNLTLFSIAQIFISSELGVEFYIIAVFAVITSLIISLKIDKNRKQAFFSFLITCVMWITISSLSWPQEENKSNPIKSTQIIFKLSSKMIL